jgi:hypothetical protein
MRYLGALIIFSVLAAIFVPFVRMLWSDRPKRGDNYQDAGDNWGSANYGSGHDGGHGGSDGGSH